jgi:glycosyltransferase involved in cell wall biosynthesis
MRILILSQHFWPESFIINDFAKNLKEQGHEVFVATGKPNYPTGRIFEGYKILGIQTEFYEGISVFRVPLWPRGPARARHLILNYLSFIVSGLLFFPWMLRSKKIDHIVVFASSPLIQAIPAILLKYLKNAHLSIWVQDLWPESLSATGHIKNETALSAVGKLVKFIYWQSDTLLVQSKAFIGSVARFAEKSKIIYFPNLFDRRTMEISEGLIPTDLKKQLSENFSIVFAGNLGTAQSLETIIHAAELVSDLKDVKIVIVGSGSLGDWLQKQVEQKKLSNIFLAGRFPMQAMPEIFFYSKVLLVTLKADPIFELTVPSKVQAYLAAGKPILAAIDGEGARVIDESGAGLTGGAGDAASLAANMRKFHSMDADTLNKMSLNAKNYFDKNFDMSTETQRFVNVLTQRSKSQKG